MGGSLCSCDTLLERLAEDFQDVALALGEFIQEEDTMVRQGHLPWQGPLAAADHAHLRDRVLRGPERARGDEGGAPPGEASDAVNARGLERFRQGHRRQDGGEPPRQHD